jgi:hypothetical protein
MGMGIYGYINFQREIGMRQWICVLSLVLLFTSIAGAEEWVQLTAATTPVAVQVMTQSPQSTILTSTINGFDKANFTINNEYFSLATLEGEALTWQAGYPELPRLHRSLIIPDDALMAVRLVASEYRDVPNVKIAPSKGHLSRSVDPASVPYSFASVYQKDAFWPEEVVSLAEPYIMRDFRGQVVQIAPFQYNPVTHTLRVYTSLTIEVYQVGRGGENVFTRIRPLDRIVPEFRQMYAQHFVNFNALDYTMVDEVGPMLVIANSAFMANVQPLVNWKRQKGIPTTLVNVSTIGNTSTAIKNYITTQYNSPAGLAYVLLVGDQAQVTSWMIGSSGCDPVYGQITGSDHYAEVFIGRLSAENSAQVDNQVTKFVEYEKMPQTGAAWYAKGLGVASNQGVGAGHNGEGDWQHMNIIRQKLLTYGFTQVDSVYDAWGTQAMITTDLNAGRSMVNYCGHGSDTSWGTTGYSNTQVNALTNDNMLPVIVSVACVNGNFTSTTCFAEAWLRASHNGEPSGAIGFFGSSQNQSWAPPMDAEEEYIDNLVRDNLHVYGALCFNGVSKMVDLNGATGNSEADHWNLFGDPSLQLRTQPPTALTVQAPASVNYGQASMQVTVSGYGAGGALAGLYANGTLLGYGYTNASGVATLNLTWTPIGSSATLTVTSYNRLPFIVEIPVAGGTLPNLDVNLTPVNPPIVIPASGGSFGYSINLLNNETYTVNSAVWIMQQLPNLTWQGPMLGPISVALPAGANITRSRAQTVPASAPAGTYTYRAYIGQYSTQKWDSSSFTYTKSTAGDGPIVNEWTNSGEEFSGNTAAVSTPAEFVLEGAFPNPFNPSTAISYQLQAASQVNLKVFDTTGRLVATLVDGLRDAGRHQVTFDGSHLASGLYLYTLTAGQYHATGKVVLIK